MENVDYANYPDGDVQSENLSTNTDDSPLVHLLYGPDEIRRLKQLTKKFSNRPMVLSAVSPRSLFDTIMGPRRFSMERYGAHVGKYFWGHRRNHMLEELIVEAAMLTDLSPWRMAAIACRHIENADQFAREAFTTEADLLCRVIENLGDCPRALAELAYDDNAAVRIAVADNMYADLRTLFVLAEDRSTDVRFALAENHNAPIAVLQFLVEDVNPYVQARAQRTLARLISADTKASLLNRLTRKARRRATA
jgi:hypothetical protein